MPVVQRGGAAIHYERSGAGPVALLIQGVGMLAASWQPQLEALAGEFSLLRFDHRGLGASTRGPGALSIAAMAADALAVMDAAGVERCHVAGHSMGTLVAQELALVAPARVKSLALLCALARGRDALAPSPSLVWLSLRSALGTPAMRRRAALELVLPPQLLAQRGAEALAREYAPLFGRDLAQRPPQLLGQLWALARYDARARLGQLSGIPTLVASAELDRIAPPSSGRELAGAIRGARFALLAGAGHAVPIHRPAEVNSLLREWFAAAERAPA